MTHGRLVKEIGLEGANTAKIEKTRNHWTEGKEVDTDHNLPSACFSEKLCG